MTNILRIRRGTSSEIGSLVGELSELTYNTTTKNVHVHDGSTAGGVPLVTKAMLDSTLTNYVKTSDSSSLASASLVSSTPSANKLLTLDSSGYLPTNAASATTIPGRTISVTGALNTTTPATFDGSGNVSITTTLPTTGVTAATYGNGTQIPVVTVNDKGYIVTLSYANMSISGSEAILIAAGTTGASNAASPFTFYGLNPVQYDYKIKFFGTFSSSRYYTFYVRFTDGSGNALTSTFMKNTSIGEFSSYVAGYTTGSRVCLGVNWNVPVWNIGADIDLSFSSSVNSSNDGKVFHLQSGAIGTGGLITANGAFTTTPVGLQFYADSVDIQRLEYAIYAIKKAD